MATVYNLEIEQGIPFKKKFLVRNADNSSVPLAGYSARMQFRPYASSSVVSIDATTANAKLIINTSDSSVEINLSEADTTSLEFKNYVYDIEIVDTSSVPLRLVQGKVTVSQEITRN